MLDRSHSALKSPVESGGSSLDFGEILTLDEVAKYLKIPRKTVYEMTRSGKLRAFRAGKHWRVPRSELDAWIIRQLPEQETATK